MAFKTILLPIRESSTALTLMETAIAMAIRNEGHLDMLFVQSDVDRLIPTGTLGLSQSMRESIKESASMEATKELNALKDNFDTLCKNYGIEQSTRENFSRKASADFLVRNGKRDELIGQYGRLADLIIVPQPLKTTPPPSSFEAALRDSGRPVLMVQREKVLENPGKRIAIGWNSSKEAAQAISSMLANLKRAEQVFVMTSDNRMTSELNANDVCTYLRCHDINAEAVTFDTQHQSAGKALLQKSEELNCDRLIVGGYSHPRIRDIIFGGVTGHMLSSAKMPVIFVH
jgi:nucleotide-binding universal stress UspA family protein